MIEEYITFQDDDDLAGVWYCGTMEHHFFAYLLRKDGRYHIKMQAISDRVLPGKEDTFNTTLAALNNQSIECSVYKDDNDAWEQMHEMLYLIAPVFMEQQRKDVGGIVFIRPCKGAEAKKKLLEQPWDRLLGIDTLKGSC